MINDKWEKIKSYLIHDNGARPYLVTFGDKNVIIYKNDDGNFKVMNIIDIKKLINFCVGTSSGKYKSSGHSSKGKKQFDGNTIN